MNMRKSLAVSAVSGILMGAGLMACGAEKPADPKVPTTDNAAAPGAPAGAATGEHKGSCSGKGSCGGAATPPPAK